MRKLRVFPRHAGPNGVGDLVGAERWWDGDADVTGAVACTMANASRFPS